MDRRRAMLWLMLAGSVMFTTYTLWPAGTTAPVKANVPPGTPSSATAPSAAVPTTGVATPVPPLSEQDWVAWRGQLRGQQRDPFFTAREIAAMSRPRFPERTEAPVQQALPQDYAVRLVVMSGSVGKALIGNQVVKVGDMLGDERVAAIRPDGVVLERNGARRRLDVATGGANAARIQLERTR